ncbi:hypothetical protein EDB84DRAFT_1503370 [Lactarius hengduanensis]|nr:hypothetical protein EDB84DRAFT_1503370 [Lactarius hengduanensis]
MARLAWRACGCRCWRVGRSVIVIVTISYSNAWGGDGQTSPGTMQTGQRGRVLECTYNTYRFYLSLSRSVRSPCRRLLYL